MEISATSGSYAPQSATNADRQVAVMKKSRDIEKATAEALLALVQPAPTGHVGRIINTYA